MALKIWLPLNGGGYNEKISNWGLSNITITNHGATPNESGKISTTYDFNGNDSYIELSSPLFYDIFKGGSQPFSIMAWVYHGDSTRAILFGDYNLSGAINFNIELTTGHQVRFYWAGSPDKTFTTAVLPLSAWAHIAITYDGVNKLCCYLNGDLKEAYTVTLGTKTKTSGSYYIGRDSRTGATAFNGRMNDFRIYNNCLSVLEVKEIAQGLVMHYKLNGLASGVGENRALHTSNTWTEIALPQYYVFIQEDTHFYDFKAGDTITYSVYLKAPTDKKIRARVQFYNTDSDRPNIYGNYINAGEEGYSAITWTLTTTQRNYPKMQLLIDCNDGTTHTATAYYKELKLEYGSQRTPWVPFAYEWGGGLWGSCVNSAITQGILYGVDCLPDPTAYYGYSATITESDYFDTGSTPLWLEALTVSWRGYSDNWTDWANATSIVKVSNSKFYVRNNKLYFSINEPSGERTAVSSVTVNTLNGTWHHFAGTYDGATVNLYIDGQLSGTATYSPKIAGTQVWMGIVANEDGEPPLA